VDFQEDPEEVDEGAPPWMATFADMATLLMTFFVLMLSFANMDIVEFRTLMGSVRDAFGVQFEQPGDFQARANSPIWISEGGSPSSPSILENSPTIQRVRAALRDRDLDDVVEAEMDRRGVALRIRGAILFESGSDQLLQQGVDLLSELGELSREFVDEVAIEGHTDNRPISTSRFPSNWELSAARATAVLRHLDRGAPGEMVLSIAGYADTRPVADNDLVEGRSRNRRVELILIRPPARDAADPSAASPAPTDAEPTDPTPAAGVVVEGMPVEGSLVEGMPVVPETSGDASSEGASSEGASTEDASTEDASTEDASADEVAPEDAAAGGEGHSDTPEELSDAPSEAGGASHDEPGEEGEPRP